MCSGSRGGVAETDLLMQRFPGRFQGTREQRRCEIATIRKKEPRNRASPDSDLPLKPAHPFMDGGKERGSKIRKLGVGFTRRMFIRRFPKVLEIRRSNVEELEDNVDDLRLASPRSDKG